MPAGALRRPFFFAAVAVVVLIVLTEFGLSFVLHGHPPSGAGQLADPGLGVGADGAQSAQVGPAPTAGSGIRYLALIDGLLLYTVGLQTVSLLVPQRLYGRLQGILTLVVTIVWLIVGLICLLVAIIKLMLMIGLFVAAPFGTLVYLALWGFFPTGTAAALLGFLLLLKLVFVGLLFLAQPRFLREKGLMILVGLSVGLQLVLGLIQGFLPGVVVSIGDEFWAIVTAVVALVWALLMLIMSIPAIVNTLRSVTSVASS